MSVDDYAIICPHCGGMVPSRLDACQTCGHLLASAPGLAAGGAPMASQVGATETESDANAWRVRPRHFAGFWIRVLAYFIDSLILLVPAVLLRHELGTGGALLAVVVDWIYFAGLESSSSRATFGKMVVGVTVSDQGGNQISFGRATGRYFAKIISALTLGIGFLMVAWTDRKRGLHDMIAGTVVVRS